MTDNAPDTISADERWYLASMNDGLFIINRPPRPSNDGGPGDVPNAPTLVLPISGLAEERASDIVNAHNTALHNTDRAVTAPSGNKIIDGLKDAVAGNFSRVTIDGEVWVKASTVSRSSPEGDNG